MTYAAPSFDYYDDGLVHSHSWARNTPPGGKHGERTHASASHEHDENKVHEHRRAHD
jgi:hypothetical protein